MDQASDAVIHRQSGGVPTVEPRSGVAREQRVPRITSGSSDRVQAGDGAADVECERPRRIEGTQHGWREQGVLVVSPEDERLSWPERELVRQLGEKLYGRRETSETRHG